MAELNAAVTLKSAPHLELFRNPQIDKEDAGPGTPAEHAAGPRRPAGRPAPHLLVLLLQLGGLLLVRLLVVRGGVIPHLPQLLCDVANGQAGVLSFDFGAILRTKQEKGRTKRRNCI